MDNNSLTEIVAKYRKTVFRIALGYVKNTHDADDITQNVFMKLCDKSDAFVSEEARKAWLIRVTINESKNLLKSSWFRRRESLDESLAAPEKEEEIGIFEYVKALKPKYRTVIYLYYYERYTSVEIAKLLKMPESTVTTHLHRAREQLKETILKEDSYYGKQTITNL